jgi:MFS family permease
MMQATAAAVITTMIAPNRRKAALGIFATVLGLGPVLGPTVGGLTISWAGWRPVFWIKLPVCLFGLWSCAALKRHVQVHRKVRLDMIGNLLLVALIFVILQILSTWRGVNPSFAEWDRNSSLDAGRAALALRDRVRDLSNAES